MGALILLIYLMFMLGIVYPLGAIIYYKLIRRSKLSIKDILDLI